MQIQDQIEEDLSMAKQRSKEGKREAAKNIMRRKKIKEKRITRKKQRLRDLDQEVASFEKKIMTDCAEAAKEQCKISAALASPLSALDENEVYMELKEMQAEPDNELDVPEDGLPELPEISSSDNISEAEEDSVNKPTLVSAQKI